MTELEDAIERIKELECPTGEVEDRVAEILEEYEVAEGNDIIVLRDENYDTNEAEAYSAKIPGEIDKSLVVLSKSGLDDYVAKVIDVHID